MKRGTGTRDRRYMTVRRGEKQMKKFSLLGIAALFVMLLPMAAHAADPTAPCEQSSEYTNVGLAGAHEDVTPELIPGVPGDLLDDPDSEGNYRDESVVRLKYRIDVSGSSTTPSAQTADVRITLRWDNESDYDLYVYDASGELARSPSFVLTGGVERIFLPQVAHCTDLRVDIINAVGLPTNEMTLDTTIGGLE